MNCFLINSLNDRKRKCGMKMVKRKGGVHDGGGSVEGGGDEGDGRSGGRR